MGRLTVSLPACDAGEVIRKAIQSVLEQADVEFDLIVVDRGSRDGTVEVVSSFQDSRIRFFQLDRKATIADCHNLALEQSTSTFFGTLNPLVRVLPGAFQKMIFWLESSADTGMVVSYFFLLDEEEKITRDNYRSRVESLNAMMGPDADYTRSLLVSGAGAIGHLRLYRTEIFQTLGNFQRRKLEPDYEMALRVLKRNCIVPIPEHLYSWRIDPNNSNTGVRAFLDWMFRVFYIYRIPKSERERRFHENAPEIRKLMLLGLSRALRLQDLALTLKDYRKFLFSHWRGFKHKSVQKLYYTIVRRFPQWPLRCFSPQRNHLLAGESRIAYYVWHFPVLSQTFVNRELSALKKSGIALFILADEPEDPALADENAKMLLANTRYLLPMDSRALRRYRRFFFNKNPLRYLSLFFFVITHRYGPFKNLFRDRKVFSKAIYIAGILKEEKITHLHSPWSDRCAFLSLLASKMLGITYSVQARAHEIHRIPYLPGLREKFENANFVITNSQYNLSYLETIVRKEYRDRIEVIYNGIDLDRFTPNGLHETRQDNFKILSVGRLIEQKGLVYLLKACRILKDRRIPFRCEVIGGPEENLYMNYHLELRKLHQRLDLSDCVVFTDVLPFKQVLEAYRRSDAFVMPSVIAKDGSRDITPNALIEAMAMKLPVIATTVTAIPEIVEDGVSGMLIPEADENALATALIRLMDDRDLRKKLGENARKKVEARFDISKNVLHYLEVFGGLTTKSL